MKRVTGIGGILFKCKDTSVIKNWYRDHLGFQTDDYGAMFEWRENEPPHNKACTQWSPFSETTNYFAPSDKPFMLNFRVENLVELLALLKNEGVTIVGEMQEFEYGKFAWIIDPEGNKIELWEPVDEAFNG